jgi:hypothetical protein
LSLAAGLTIMASGLVIASGMICSFEFRKGQVQNG